MKKENKKKWLAKGLILIMFSMLLMTAFSMSTAYGFDTDLTAPSGVISGQSPPILQIVTPRPTQPPESVVKTVFDGETVTPDSVLWWLDTTFEDISISLTFNSFSKAEKRLRFASERANEINKLTEKLEDESISEEKRIRVLNGIAKAEVRHNKLTEKISMESFSGLDPVSRIESQLKIRNNLNAHEVQIRQLKNIINTKDIPNSSRTNILAVIDKMEDKASMVRESVEEAQEGGSEVLDEIQLELDGKISDTKFNSLISDLNHWDKAVTLMEEVTDGGIIIILRVVDIDNIVISERTVVLSGGLLFNSEKECSNCRIFEMRINKQDFRPLIRALEEQDELSLIRFGTRFNLNEIVTELKEDASVG